MKKPPTPLVSIIVPVYNEEQYLLSCLESLRNQSYSRTEIIVIDDGSTDNSVFIARQFPVTLLTQAHTGPGAARNMGVKKAKGEIVIFADADMKYDKEYITALIKPITAGKAIGTFVKDERVANTDNIWSRCWSINAGLPFDRRLPSNYKNTENAFRAIRKDVFLEGGGYATNEGYTDDSSFSKRTNYFAINAPGAISYHYNPSSLREVFTSSRWIGRSRLFQSNLTNFLRFSPLNSFRIAVKYLRRGAPFAIIPFKLIYDAGVFVGIFFDYGKTAK